MVKVKIELKKPVYQSPYKITGVMNSDECDDLRRKIPIMLGSNLKVPISNGEVNKFMPCQVRGLFVDEELARKIQKRLVDQIEHHIEIGSQKYRFVHVRPSFTFVHYSNDGSLRSHIDKIEKIEANTIGITLLIYLNDNYDGGETYFDDAGAKISVDKETGAVLCFFGSELMHGSNTVVGEKASLSIREDNSIRLIPNFCQQLVLDPINTSCKIDFNFVSLSFVSFHRNITMKKRRIEIQRETIQFIDRNKSKFQSKIRKYVTSDYPKKAQIFPATSIEVIPMDTLEATVFLQEKFRSRYSFLVMANATNPGGGYKDGAPAQEESICRRTNLVHCLNTVKYPIPEYGSIYIRDIHILRDTEEHNYSFLKKPVSSNCLLMPAYQAPPLTKEGGLTPEYLGKTREKIHQMFNTFLENGDTRIILGAWGCGAFGNPPEDIVKLFMDVLNSAKYKNRFEHVVFAVIKGSWQNNLKTFTDYVQGYEN